MRMTVCELPSDWPASEHAWQVFEAALATQASEWVLLPEMPFDKWIAGGVTAAVVAGAFCVSSNFSGPNVEGLPFGGVGWGIEPEEGRLLGQTSQATPLVTIDINPAWAEKAKQTYPRYVRD